MTTTAHQPPPERRTVNSHELPAALTALRERSLAAGRSVCAHYDGTSGLPLPYRGWHEHEELARLDALLGTGFGEVTGELLNHALLWGVPLAGWDPHLGLVRGLFDTGEPGKLFAALRQIFADAAAAYGASLSPPAGEGGYTAPLVCTQLVALLGALARLEAHQSLADLENAVLRARTVGYRLAALHTGPAPRRGTATPSEGNPPA